MKPTESDQAAPGKRRDVIPTILERLEQEAGRSLDPVTFDYFAGGADDELTLVDNVTAWQRIRLRPRVLRGVGDVSTATTVLGSDVSLPVLIAPMGYQKLAHPEGETAVARAAETVGTLMAVSTFATVSLEDVAAAGGDAPRWFQLYVHRDRDLTEDLVRRAAAAGYQAVVLTVDLPVVGHRRRDEVNEFTLPPGMEMANVHRELPPGEGSGLGTYAQAEVEGRLTLDDVGWLRSLTEMPVVVKGVLRGDDAAAAVDAGAAGVIVSNHGGRQLDTAIATADALPDVIEAVGGRAEVYVDGGVRRGTDVVKALALGARAVFVGRPVLWGLAAAGADGVGRVIEHYRTELIRSMALCGAAAVADLDASLVA